MPRTTPKQSGHPAASQPTGPIRDKRFDPPHEVARGAEQATGGSTTAPAEEQSPGPDLKLARGELPEVIGQFRLQAQQLATHLESRQRELDRRESQLNAQLALHEAAARSARLWFQERHHELLQRQEDLDARAADPATARGGSTKTGAPSQGAPNYQAVIASEPPVDVDSMSPSELAELRQRLGRRDQRLAAAEAALVRGQLDLELGWEELNLQREELEKERGRRRAEIGERQRQMETELERQRGELGVRTNQLEMRTAALDQLRGEVLHVQRETLEMRLATEELWVRLSRSVPPATVTQTLARLRSKLAEQHRLQTGEIADQRQEVDVLTSRLAQQHERIAARRQEIEQWAINQQREIESQAAMLAAREKEIEAERQAILAQRLKWDAQRRDLEREIRGLQAELRKVEAAVA